MCFCPFLHINSVNSTKHVRSIYTIILLKSVCLSVGVRSSQFLLDLLGRCLKLFVSAESISCREIAFQFGLAFFYTRKTSKYRGNGVASACGYLNSQRSALSQAERTVTVGRHRIAIACAPDGDCGNGCVCARVCVRTRVRACVNAHACARVRVCMRDVFATYDKHFDPG